ncbi:hypothetical protein ACW0TQ_07925 [Oceanobacillus sp. M60]
MENKKFEEASRKINIKKPIAVILTVFGGVIGYLSFAQQISLLVNVFIILILLIAVLAAVVIYLYNQYRLLVINYNELLKEYKVSQNNRNALANLHKRSNEKEDNLKQEIYLLKRDLNFVWKFYSKNESPTRKEIIEHLDSKELEVHEDGK